MRETQKLKIEKTKKNTRKTKKLESDIIYSVVVP